MQRRTLEGALRCDGKDCARKFTCFRSSKQQPCFGNEICQVFCTALKQGKRISALPKLAACGCCRNQERRQRRLNGQDSGSDVWNQSVQCWAAQARTIVLLTSRTLQRMCSLTVQQFCAECMAAPRYLAQGTASGAHS